MSTELFRVCVVCNIEKPVTFFYKNQKQRCKQCQNKFAYQLEIENGNGTRWQVRQKPNDYYNDAQRDELFGLMISMGWTFTDGIWWKEKFGKNVDGTFNFPKEKVAKSRKRRTDSYDRLGGAPKRFDLDIFVPQMIEYKTQGMTYDNIAGIYGCSHTTIRRFIREYYEKRTS